MHACTQCTLSVQCHVHVATAVAVQQNSPQRRGISLQWQCMHVQHVHVGSLELFIEQDFTVVVAIVALCKNQRRRLLFIS